MNNKITFAAKLVQKTDKFKRVIFEIGIDNTVTVLMSVIKPIRNSKPHIEYPRRTFCDDTKSVNLQVVNFSKEFQDRLEIILIETFLKEVSNEL